MCALDVRASWFLNERSSTGWPHIISQYSGTWCYYQNLVADWATQITATMTASAGLLICMYFLVDTLNNNIHELSPPLYNWVTPTLIFHKSESSRGLCPSCDYDHDNDTDTPRAIQSLTAPTTRSVLLLGPSCV